jgi:two-component system chemotaxis response regulator CheB
MIKILVVDDSQVCREFLQNMLAADPECVVVGAVSNGEEACRFVQRHRPDVITMDIEMPRMNGYEATRRIMEMRPVPVVIVTSSWDRKSVQATFEALQTGAVTVVDKPVGVGHPGHEAAAKRFVETVKLMSEVKVVRRWASRREIAPDPGPAAVRAPAASEIRVVAIGASTGGPPVLHTILAGLPPGLGVPVLIVQHIAPGFVNGLADWLNGSGFPVRVATHGEFMLPGHAYLAPDGSHMGVDGVDRIALSQKAPEHLLRPAVSYLFRSVTTHFGPHAIGVLLTGMGRDGAAELLRMREAGALTIAQDFATSAVHGMPGEAIRLHAARQVLSPEGIVGALAGLARAAG